MSGFDLKDYVDVAQRLQDFYAKYPDGSIQSEIVEMGRDRVTVKAYAYRTADDPRPGIGHSWLGIPGMTPYTRGSELENAETSAVGRAIAMLGFAVKGGIASRQEVMNKQGEGERPARPAADPDGVVTFAGTVKRGTGNGMDMLMRQGPDGPSFGFKIVDAEGLGRGSTGVRAFGAAAIALAAHADTLEGQRLTMSGHVRGESFKKDGKDVKYDVIVLLTADGPDFTFPPDVPADGAAPVSVDPGPSSADLQELETMPW